MIQGWSTAGKAWTGLIGSLLTFVVPYLVQQSAGLPSPWPAVIGAVVAVLTALGIYNAPYKPASGHGGEDANTPWPTS